jgi:hypothetical protein
MRLNNKITIKGDTLTIFKESMFNPMKGGADLGVIAKKIYDELQLMGSYDSSDRQSLIKQAGLSGKDAEAVSDMLFDMDADERYDEAINEAKKEKSDPKDKKKADKTNYGRGENADVDMVNPYELKKGIRIEMVDIEDYIKAMDKAVKKLKKDPMFYTNLIANAKQVKADKRSDLPKEVKDKKLNKTSDKLKDKANEMEVSKKDVTKKNANETLNKKETAKGKPKGVKEMTMKPKSSKGMKSMEVPGKETKAKLKESINIFNSFKKKL